MRQYVIKRLLLMIPTLFGVALLVFFLLRVAPGDIVELKYAGSGTFAPKEALDRERKQLGLDKPLAYQFISWIAGVARFDFGNSMWTGQPIANEIKIRLELSVQLAVMATLVAIVLAVPLGTLAALKQDTWIDYAVRIFAIGGLAMATRMTRSAVLEVLREDYVRTARAKGLWERAVVVKHALSNALLPIVTVIGLEFAFLIGGLVVTEQVFNLNGIGMLFVESITHRDYTMTQALVLLVSFVFIFMNFLIDLLYAWLDPRIHYR